MREQGGHVGHLVNGPAAGADLPGLNRGLEYVAMLDDGPWLCPERLGPDDNDRLRQARGRWSKYRRVDYDKPAEASRWAWVEGPEF
jgi:hypothetical protein